MYEQTMKAHGDSNRSQSVHAEEKAQIDPVESPPPYEEWSGGHAYKWKRDCEKCRNPHDEWRASRRLFERDRIH